MIFDLSHKLAPNMPAYPGLPIPKFHVFLAHGDVIDVDNGVLRFTVIPTGTISPRCCSKS